jgi:2-methylcitrate dehydratase PrpD
MTPIRRCAALALAAGSAGGLVVNFGTMAKSRHAGFAVRNGLLAARLARVGRAVPRGQGCFSSE